MTRKSSDKVNVEKRDCSNCKQTLPITEFTKDRRRKSGINGRCKTCKANADWRRNGQGTPDRDWDKPDLNILSLGAGVQSSTVLLMSCQGELPKLDAAIFADTGWEPPEVYEWLQTVLIPAAQNANIPLVQVNAGTILDRRGFMSVPAFVPKDNGKTAMLRRQCTNEYKIKPVRAEIHRRTERGRKNVDQWFGISTDEISRMSTSDVLYIRHHYPLVDKNLTRNDCQEWLQRNGYGKAPRSACVGCPYHSDKEWSRLKTFFPDLFEQAVQFEQDLWTAWGQKGYLHKSCVPLNQVELNDQTAAGEDCTGYCWT